jgi:hypothetical protein
VRCYIWHSCREMSRLVCRCFCLWLSDVLLDSIFAYMMPAHHSLSSSFRHAS